jgi:uncharacterized protein YlbG (UPF0298 family)
MREKRLGLAVWVKHTRMAKNLRKFGTIHYISKRLNYVSMYVDAAEIDNVIRTLERLPFVTRVERSHRHEIPVEYNNAKPDKAKEYDYRQEKSQLIALADSLVEATVRTGADEVQPV